MSTHFTINGAKVSVETPGVQDSLLDHLRLKERLRGTKSSCRQGGCGACTVLVDGVATASCLVPVISLHGKAVTTIEGLGNAAAPGPAQKAMSTASQCGYCTPGFAMSLEGARCRAEAKGLCPKDAVQAIDGNICRCTGYRAIVDAAMSLCSAPADIEDLAGAKDKVGQDCGGHDHPPQAAQEHKAGLTTVIPTSPFPPRNLGAGAGQQPQPSQQQPSKPAKVSLAAAGGVKYVRPLNVEQVQELRVGNVGRLDFAGGSTSHGVYHTFPPKGEWTRVDLTQVAELRDIAVVDAADQINGLSVGAAVTLTELIAALRTHAERSPTTFPQIADHLERIGSTFIRNRATWAGNLMLQKLKGFTSDLAVVALAARFFVHVSPLPGASEVTVTLDNFFDLPDDMLIVSMTIPFAKPSTHLFSYRTALRPVFSHALSLAAFLVTVDPAAANKVVSVRAVFGAVGKVPVRAKECEAALCGSPITDDAKVAAGILAAAREVKLSPEPTYKTIDDPEGKEAYRAAMVPSYVRRMADDLAATLSGAGRPAWALERPVPSSQLVVPESMQGRSHERAEGIRHATGQAQYTDDLPSPEGCLFASPVFSPFARARIVSVDPAPALALPGVVAFVGPDDVTGVNDVGLYPGEEPVFARGEVHHVRQTLGLIVASSQALADSAARAVKVVYEELPAVLTIEAALALGQVHPEPASVESGDVGAAFAAAAHVVEGTARVHGQLHFYMEKVAVLACPEEGGTRFVVDTVSQCPDITREKLSAATGLAGCEIALRMRRAGGGFGGKASRPLALQCAVLLAARKLNRPVRAAANIWADAYTGGRHDFVAKYRLALDAAHRFLGAEIVSHSNAGYSRDMSPYVANDYTEALDSVYCFPAFRASTHMCRTNLPSKSAFRSFGKVQAVAIVEQMLDDAAAVLGVPAAALRRQNLYTPRNSITPFGRHIDDLRIPQMWDDLARSSDLAARAAAAAAFNGQHRWVKRGLSQLAIKFPVSWQHSNGASVLVAVSGDGTVVVHHAGCELGQGLNEKVQRTVADTLGCPMASIKIADTNTDVVPNAPHTGGSATSEINAAAARAACLELVGRLEPVRRALRASAPPAAPEPSWKEVAAAANAAKVNLSYSANFQAPGRAGADVKDGIYGPWNTGPADYYVQAAIVAEAEVDVLTGESRMVRVDILNDAGLAFNPAVDLGQIEGAFVQGMGYFRSEDTLFDARGHNRAMDTWEYKPPLVTDIPSDLRITLQDTPFARGLFRSKATGEPAYLLSYACQDAIKDAVRASRLERNLPARFTLRSPSTPDRIRDAAEISLDHLKSH